MKLMKGHEKMNQFRKDLAIQSYILIDKDRRGFLDLRTLETRLGENWDKFKYIARMDSNGDGNVTMQEWIAYYDSISIDFDEDVRFAHLVDSTWGLKGKRATEFGIALTC